MAKETGVIVGLHSWVMMGLAPKPGVQGWGKGMGLRLYLKAPGRCILGTYYLTYFIEGAPKVKPALSSI
jgi:hypothetical protein